MNNLVNTEILAQILAQILNGDMNSECPIEFEFYSSLEILAYSRFGLKDILETTTKNGSDKKLITLTELLNKYCSDSKSFVESIFYTIFNTPKLLDKNYNPIQSFELQRSGYEEKYSRLASFLSQKLTINIDSRGNISEVKEKSTTISINDINITLLLADIGDIDRSTNTTLIQKIQIQLEGGTVDKFLSVNLKKVGLDLSKYL